MTERTSAGPAVPAAFKALFAMGEAMKKAAADAGLDPALPELVKIRASQMNACAFCLDMHTRDAAEMGEDPRRLHMLAAWRETELYTEQERVALEITEALTDLASTRDLSDDLYRRAMEVFTEQQYSAIVWAVTVINSWNRLNVASRTPLP